jgi:hypothetical protein
MVVYDGGLVRPPGWDAAVAWRREATENGPF